jgi:hypothetical protein
MAGRGVGARVAPGVAGVPAVAVGAAFGVGVACGSGVASGWSAGRNTGTRFGLRPSVPDSSASASRRASWMMSSLSGASSVPPASAE